MSGPPHGSFQARLSGVVALAVFVAVAVAALSAYLIVDRQLYGAVNRTLTGEYNTCTNEGDLGSLLACTNQIVRTQGAIALFTAQGQAVTLPVSPTDQLLLAAEPQLTPNRAQLALAAKPGASRLVDSVVSGRHYRVLSASITLGPTPVILMIADPIDPTLHTLSELRLLLGLVAALGVAVAVLLGSGIALATLRPVKRLTDAAEHVAATQDLSAHIEVEREDELGRLARSFNEMLAALRSSREQQAQLVSDAGHELRTPLTSLRTNIELLLRAGNLPEQERRELLGDVRDQLEELTALVGDIVDTARQDERVEIEPAEVRLDDLVGHAVERARRRGTQLHWDVHLDSGSVRAQPALLERAVLNVLDNAAKWSPPAGTVTVRLRRGPEWLLEVSDQGPGIDQADLPRVFDRFYRAASARSMPGSGLGLAIVQRVVQEHGGSVQLANRQGGGTLVTVRLPVVAEDEPAWKGTASGPAWGPPAAPAPH